MVRCPKCGAAMTYRGIEADISRMSETEVNIYGDIRYKCALCKTTVSIHFDKDVPIP